VKDSDAAFITTILVSETYFLWGKALSNIYVIRMPYCPECGGEMQYMSATKCYACKSCGLSVTRQELMELRAKLRPRMESEEEEQRKRKKEYLKWWLSKKK
jgi:hypothetical protein